MLIRQAQVARAGGWLVLRAQVSSQGKETECFYSVPERFADFADAASSNCFLVGLLYPAMRWGEDIHVEGKVSARLLFNINEFLVPFMSMCDSRLKPIKATAEKNREAAKKGVPEAMYNLGMRCLEGIGVPKSRKEGLFWLRQAAKRKEPKARKVLRALGED